MGGIIIGRYCSVLPIRTFLLRMDVLYQHRPGRDYLDKKEIKNQEPIHSEILGK